MCNTIYIKNEQAQNKSYLNMYICFFNEQEKDKSLSGTPDFSPDWR